MKKTLSILSIVLIWASFGSVRASAQASSFQSGYFLDNFVYGYRLNPAIMSEKGFVGLALGNVDAGLGSGLGLSSILYPNASGTGLVTGLNSSVSKEQFLSGIRDANNLGIDFGMNILSVGIRKDKWMGTFEVNVRADANAALPGDFFRFLKCGSSDRAYDLSSLYAGGKAYAEAAFGYAFITDDKKFTFGGRLKALVGLANANLYFDQASITSNADMLSVKVDGGIRAACMPLNFGTDADGNMTYDFNGNIKPSGYGAAVDLGVKWEPISDLTVTAGINDLGAIQWNYNSFAKARGGAEFTGFSNVDTQTNFEEEIQKISDSLMEIANMTPASGSEKKFERLSFTANAGVRYRIPVVKIISVGALATYRFDTISSWYDARMGATLTPWKWLSLTANVGHNSNCGVYGGALSISVLCFNLYMGADGYMGSVGVYPMEDMGIPVLSKVKYPVNPFRYKLNFGLTVQFGKRRSL